MPQERGYERQVGTAQPVGLPDASPASFGAGVGAAIADAGQSVHQAKLRAYQVERQQTADSEAADFAARFARTREAADQASIDARNGAQPGGAGHAEAMAGWWEKQAGALAEGITDDRVRARAQEQLQEFGGRFRSAEYQWQEGTRVGKLVTDTGELTQLSANRARRSHDAKSYAEELSLGRQSIEAMSGVPEDVRDKLIRAHDETVTVGYFNGLIDTNPALVPRLLDSGGFDRMLPPEQMDRLRNGSEVEVRRAEATQRAQAAQATAVQRDQLGAVETDLNAGAGSYDDRVAIAGRYDAMGDKSKAAEWRGKAAEFQAVQGSRDWTLPQMDARIGALQAKKAGGGVSAAEARELNGLVDQRGASAGRLGQPGGALMQLQYATGQALAALDPNDPGSIAARGAQARTAASMYGRAAVEPILATELPAFKDLAADGATGKLKVLDAIRGFGDGRTIAGAARQIAGADDGAFRIAAVMPREVARDILRGGDTLKANPQVWKDANARADFAKWYGPALTFMQGSYRTDVLEAARAFYGQRASDGGLHQYDPGKFSQAIETVMGGVARTPQGIVLVPGGRKPADVLTAFARATPLDYAHAAGGHAPRWGDGSVMKERDFKALLPTMVADGVYGFRGRNGQLVHDETGDTYTITLAKLGRGRAAAK